MDLLAASLDLEVEEAEELAYSLVAVEEVLVVLVAEAEERLADAVVLLEYVYLTHSSSATP